MGNTEDVVGAVKFIVSAIAEQIDRRALIDDLQAIVETVEFQQLSTLETVRILQEMIDHLQDDEEAKKLMRRPKAG